jgi:hypothetical protein
MVTQTTSSHNIKEDGNAIRTNGERPRWITPYQKTSNTNDRVTLKTCTNEMFVLIAPCLAKYLGPKEVHDIFYHQNQ